MSGFAVTADQLLQGDVFTHAEQSLVVVSLTIGVNGVVSIRYRNVKGAQPGRMMLSREVEVLVTFRHIPPDEDEALVNDAAAWRSLMGCSTLKVVHGASVLEINDTELGRQCFQSIYDLLRSKNEVTSCPDQQVQSA